MEESNAPRSLSEEDRQYFGASIRHREGGVEYYSAREAFQFLGYTKWGAFLRAFNRARSAYRPIGDVPLHFRPIERLTPTSRRLRRTIDDYHLSRRAFLLVVMNADSHLPMVAHGKNYIALSVLAAQQGQQATIIIREDEQERWDPYLPLDETEGEAEHPAGTVSLSEAFGIDQKQEQPIMSTVKTFLVLIFSDWAENWREELLIMDEEQALFELERAGMNAYPERRERHLLFELKGPLTQEQLDWLEGRKRAGLFLNFMVQDEITPDIPEGYA